ncbi:hypothetical protein OH77DRAFT_1391920 [Trametes cingulata]|nr:hypothetical protein OH77DRAFT_1391920 [Trametes cingulata]
MMVPWLHFTSGDNLLFETWQPSSKGAVAGACIGLFLFALFERWINAMRGAAEDYWRRRAALLTKQAACHSSSPSPEPKGSADVDEVPVTELPSQSDVPLRTRARAPRTVPPFIPSHDVPRGVLYAFHTLLTYALMLVVMTFQAAFIISIVLGSGIGEVLFGRVGSAQNHLLH